MGVYLAFLLAEREGRREGGREGENGRKGREGWMEREREERERGYSAHGRKSDEDRVE